jgi:hypothetical protein
MSEKRKQSSEVYTKIKINKVTDKNKNNGNYLKNSRSIKNNF